MNKNQLKNGFQADTCLKLYYNQKKIKGNVMDCSGQQCCYMTAKAQTIKQTTGNWDFIYTFLYRNEAAV